MLAAKLSQQAGAPGITGEASPHRRRAGASCWGIREQGHGVIDLSSLSPGKAALPWGWMSRCLALRSPGLSPRDRCPTLRPTRTGEHWGHVQTPLVRALTLLRNVCRE